MAQIKPISIIEKIFSKNYQLIEGTDDIFELELALWEYNNLSKEELINRSAYFKSVDGYETIHYRACNLQNIEYIHRNASFRTKVFFLDGKYSTGYATHSLFPYRGKFHPQLIRALLNVLGLKPGNVVLDPMGGSGTLAVEANLLGIDAISLDLSPFCQLMGKVKTFGLNLDSKKLKKISENSEKIFSKLDSNHVPHYFNSSEKNPDKNYYEIFLLAYLDTVGFANRSNSSIKTLFPKVLMRYLATIDNFQKAKSQLNLKIGKSKIIQGSALNLPLESNSIDAVITSPPYSFAIDYIKNDQPQLQYLKSDINELKREMIGLQGKQISEKLTLYFDKILISLKEIARVTKKNAPIVFIVGNNDIQTNGIRLDKEIKTIAEDIGLKFEFDILKPVKGIQNTMKNEFIIFLTKKNN